MNHVMTHSLLRTWNVGPVTCKPGIGADGQGRMMPVPAHVMVYEIVGPMFFGAADKIPHMPRDTGRQVLILRMRAVPAMDITALNGLLRLYTECRDKNIQVVFSHVNEQPMSVFQKSGMFDLVGAENFQPNIDAAMARAMELEGRAPAAGT